MNSTQRTKVTFTSEGVECAAWHYRGWNGACVVMAGGFAVPKEPATDLFAARFHDAGFSVLAFDYRRLGESGGEPRLVLPIGLMSTDWAAALDFAATLPEVDPQRLGVWGFSASGGLLFEVAATNPAVTAAVMQTPNMGGLSAIRNAASYQRPSTMLHFTARAIRDAVCGLFGRPPLLVPLVGERGSVAMLSTPDAFDGVRALRADEHPDWQQAVAARSTLSLSRYRGGRFAARVACPALVVVCDDDRTALPGPAMEAAQRMRQGEVFSMPGGHYAPFLTGHDAAAEAEIDFFARALQTRPVPASN
jgi:pimeloyl-ACP methyl ester carboxylesterase